MKFRGPRLLSCQYFAHRILILKAAALVSLGFSMCSAPSPSSNARVNRLVETDEFKSYWYSGKAEISSYKLDQSRYGEQHDGSAVLVFVTEDFSNDKQVKLDNPEAAVADKISVLKMNFTKNFVTGIYPYSMMLSVFKSVSGNYTHAMKATMSSQEWCG
jgi:hypothetical protein